MMKALVSKQDDSPAIVKKTESIVKVESDLNTPKKCETDVDEKVWRATANKEDSQRGNYRNKILS